MSLLDVSRIAGAATPNDPKAENSVERNLRLWESNMNDCACTILDDRLDDMISIANLTGATLDDVVQIVGQLPEATFTATVDVLTTLAVLPAPSGLQGLLQQHRAATDRIAKVETDASVANLDKRLDELEQRVMATPARTAAEAYAKMLVIFPELCVDLQAPEHAAMRSEIGEGGVTMDWQTKVVDRTIELAGNDADVQLILLVQRLQKVPDAHPATVAALTVLLQELEAVPEAHLSMIDAFTDMAKWAAQRVEQLERERLRRDGAEVLPLRFESDEEA